MTAVQDPELFPIAESLSPKLAWLQDHGLTTGKLENGRWRCWLNEHTFGVGEDEEESIVDFCIKTRIRHYSLTP